jgi:hypothetical protein
MTREMEHDMRQALKNRRATAAKLAAGLTLCTLASAAQAHAGHGVAQGLAHLLEGEHALLLFAGLWAAFAAVGLLRRRTH